MSKTTFNLSLAKQHNVTTFAQSLGLPMMAPRSRRSGGFKVVEVDKPLKPAAKKSIKKFKKKK
jgi:hypothetical protein